MDCIHLHSPDCAQSVDQQSRARSRDFLSKLFLTHFDNRHAVSFRPRVKDEKVFSRLDLLPRSNVGGILAKSNGVRVEIKPHLQSYSSSMIYMPKGVNE